jgi:ribosomal protein S18 acetylase RimI-like enzyme
MPAPEPRQLSKETGEPPSCRRAKPGDLDSLLDLENAAFSGDRLSRRQMRYHLANPRSRIWVCDGNNEIAAYILAFFHENRAPRIYSVATRKAYQGRGMAGRLVAEAEKTAKREGASKIMLEVRKDNAGTIRFYEGRGFRKTRPLPAYYEDGMDGWKMIKELD